MNKFIYNFLAIAVCFSLAVSCRDYFDETDFSELFNSISEESGVENKYFIGGADEDWVIFPSIGYHNLKTDKDGLICPGSFIYADARKDKRVDPTGNLLEVVVEESAGSIKGDILTFKDRQINAKVYFIKLTGGVEDQLIWPLEHSAKVRMKGSMTQVEGGDKPKYEGDLRIIVKLEDNTLLALGFTSLTFIREEPSGGCR